MSMAMFDSIETQQRDDAIKPWRDLPECVIYQLTWVEYIYQISSNRREIQTPFLNLIPY
jgi:hypothetical protein